MWSQNNSLAFSPFSILVQFVEMRDQASSMAQQVKNLPATIYPETQEMLVRYLGLEDPLEKEMETHSSVLA